MERRRKRAYYLANKAKVRARNDRWKEAHREEWLAYLREYRANNGHVVRKQQRAWNAANKKMVVAAYGGRCRCCGEEEIQFLTVDHISGYDKTSGQPRAGSRLYRWLRLNGFPGGFQILCWNCNAAKGMYGTCPHQSRATVAGVA